MANPVFIPTFGTGEARKHGSVVEDCKIVESLCLHHVKNQATGKSVELRRPAWPNPNLTETLRFLNFLHRLNSWLTLLDPSHSAPLSSTLVAFLLTRFSHECILKLHRCIDFGVIDLALVVAYFFKDSPSRTHVSTVASESAFSTSGLVSLLLIVESSKKT
ncbi:hypothetical protein PIB30_016244 [Stylosanthes scabra]|uniref:Uncharacterized protein n=1 Tax=Stylosanthes scabra TaxID=79078 RepID=A0ABU6X7K1_9FABA|nr:hypothetical protein [Stylosanthes scabra]